MALQTAPFYIYLYIRFPKTQWKHHAVRDCGYEWGRVQGMGGILNIWLLLGKRNGARVGLLHPENVAACFLGVSAGMRAWPG